MDESLHIQLQIHAALQLVFSHANHFGSKFTYLKQIKLGVRIQKPDAWLFWPVRSSMIYKNMIFQMEQESRLRLC